MNNKRIDLTQFEGIMNIEWLFDEQLFVGEHNRWRFAINEYTDIETLSETDIEEWENGLESVWDSLTSGVACLPDLVAELKRCYEEIDAMNGNVPYVEHCEECGATDGGEAEGCDYCGIIHYQSKPRGFYHKDSPKR